MDSAMDPPSPAVRWLVASNLIFLAGGIAAYFTRISLAITTTLALVAALPGLSRLRAELTDTQAHLWIDRAYSTAIGTWALIAVLVIVPYVTVEEGIALWGRSGFLAIMVALPSLGMLVWNASAFQAMAQWDDVRSARLYAAFHLALVTLAVYYVLQGDGQAVSLRVQGESLASRDLMLAPAIAGVPGILWAMVFWRVRPETAEGDVFAP